MDITHPELTFQAGPATARSFGTPIRKVFSSDPGLTLQTLLVIPLVSAGIVLHLNAIQWVLTLFVTLLFLVAGVFRTASLLQIDADRNIRKFEASRIRCMGNALVTITAGISLMTYLLVFVPKVIQLL